MCGLLEHGFARVRCPECRAEFLVAFRCKGRQFCPSCHARRLAEWSLWLDESLLAPVTHRQVVLTLPKRLRAYFRHDRRRRFAALSRLEYRTLRDHLCAALGEYDSGPGRDRVRAELRLARPLASRPTRARHRRCVPA